MIGYKVCRKRQSIKALLSNIPRILLFKNCQDLSGKEVGGEEEEQAGNIPPRRDIPCLLLLMIVKICLREGVGWRRKRIRGTSRQGGKFPVSLFLRIARTYPEGR
jgi:hypothetical protein